MVLALLDHAVVAVEHEAAERRGDEGCPEHLIVADDPGNLRDGERHHEGNAQREPAAAQLVQQPR